MFQSLLIGASKWMHVTPGPVDKTLHSWLVLELIGVLDCIRDYHCKKSVELTFNNIKKKKKKKKMSRQKWWLGLSEGSYLANNVSN